jgi:hypothetical protein
MENIESSPRFGFDGVTIAAAPTDFALVDGWTQGTLTGPAGILPAGLFGKVPAGDPYLAHINVLSPDRSAAGDFFELQSGTPVQPRVQFVPSPDNTRLVLVRPTDRLRLSCRPRPARRRAADREHRRGQRTRLAPRRLVGAGGRRQRGGSHP